MKICVIGTGYVGLVVGACLADMGNSVICVDNNEKKLEQLKNGIVPIFEPGLEEIVKTNLNEKRLSFALDLGFAVKNSDVCFIAVGTPQDKDGSADLTYVLEVAKKIAESMNGYKLIVNKSTVPVGTAEKMVDLIKQNTAYDFDIVSNPEFLKQGNAVDDFLSPDRVVIGSNSEKATVIMKEIYSPFLRTGNRIIVMDVKSAEMTKYAANSFLATKISFMNEIASLCEKVGADVQMVRAGIASDSRIGNKFLFPGIGFGGSCFPKDVNALIKIASEFKYDMKILSSVVEVNTNQAYKFVQKILNYFSHDLSGLTIGVWGLSFKPKTDDMREAPSIVIINELLKKGAKIQAFDPKAIENATRIFEDKIIYSENAYEACNNVDCLLLLTEWNEFRRPDFEKIKSLMKQAVIFDGRNQYDSETLEKFGFEYFCVGK